MIERIVIGEDGGSRGTTISRGTNCLSSVAISTVAEPGRGLIAGEPQDSLTYIDGDDRLCRESHLPVTVTP